MGQFFHMKYLVYYGFPVAFMLSDNIDAPSTPKCIGRIHLYSDMWRYFDNGLYKFIHKWVLYYLPKPFNFIYILFPCRYYYCPVVERIGNNLFCKLSASALTFSFIWIWHGHDSPHVQIWSLLNFLGITLEASARAISVIPTYQRVEVRLSRIDIRIHFCIVLSFQRLLLSPQGRRRFYSLLGGPLFQMSILSNFYFFMRKDLGDYFLWTTWTSFPIGTPLLLFFMYCGAQTSFEMKNWEIRHHLIKKT